MSAQEILKMIEAVDPTDTAKLDEIDARVWCYVNKRDPDGDCWIAGERKNQWQAAYLYHDSNEYTRSRDALKAIRPEGCVLSIQTSGTCALWYKSNPFHADSNFVGEGKTEELAELHATISAIEYERTK